MRIKGITDEDFVNYKLPSMYVCTSVCDFKCDRESKERCCQNSKLANIESVSVDDSVIVERYMTNPITKAIVFGGLEPMDQFDELYGFLKCLRENHECDDDVVIYTGYYPDEILEEVCALERFTNIVMKYGRFIPHQQRKFDAVLCVWLASPNQYGERIS